MTEANNDPKPEGANGTPDPPAVPDPPKVDEPKKDDDKGLSEDVRKAIADAVAEALKGQHSAGVGVRRQDAESAAQRMVEEAAQRLLDKKDADAATKAQDKDALIAEVKKAITEEQPANVSKLTKILWGGGK